VRYGYKIRFVAGKQARFWRMAVDSHFSQTADFDAAFLVGVADLVVAAALIFPSRLERRLTVN
jgi:hypothetical protein